MPCEGLSKTRKVEVFWFLVFVCYKHAYFIVGLFIREGGPISQLVVPTQILCCENKVLGFKLCLRKCDFG